MIYPLNFEHKIGFDKIRTLLTQRCLSPLGKEKVEKMSFETNFNIITKSLNRTDEFVTIINTEDEFPDNNFYDVRSSVSRIRVEGTYLDESELFDLRRSLDTIRAVIKFLNPSDSEIKYPNLQELTQDKQTFPQIISDIDRMLDKFGKIKDNASPELAKIRQELTTTMNGISRSLNSILRQAQSEGFVDKDTAPTIRDGRLVIPVAPTFKRKIKGIVHDESASGKTVFIEPSEVVEANNRIRELQSAERREIIRILVDFSSEIRPNIDAIVESYDFLAEIDFIRAKAYFAESIEAVKPVVQNKQQAIWNRAIHPLLYLSHKPQNKEIIPLDIELDENQRIVLISGPNAGGKSVCLKTMGLLQYMLQCGMLIPVYEKSRCGIFNNIFIDIGDEQSIENDLSTYSSHLTNMKYFVKNNNGKTLLLIDEFGGGTEPQIGGAIAQALLEKFNESNAYGVITTHYQNLKHFADDTEGIVNGAMLYDRHNMRPLFKLSIGNPGSSFAIEIARKIGLPDEVISKASDIVGSDYIDMDKYLQDIVRDKRYWENKRQNIRQVEKKLEDNSVKYETQLTELNQQRKEILKAAKEEAAALIAKANAKIELTIKEIKEAQAEKEKTRELRKNLSSLSDEIKSKAENDEFINNKIKKLKERQEKKKNQEKVIKKAQNTYQHDIIEKGNNVRIKGQNTIGEVVEINGNNAVVVFGMLKTTVKTDKLEKMSNSKIKKEGLKSATFVSAKTTDEIRERKLNFKQEIDLRGYRADDALQAVTYFLDDAILVGVASVRILHGTGTGVLRQLIRQYLATVNGVKSFRDEHVQLGGAGITVVELD